jgi:type II secretory pathway pseudopilin PulG
MHVHPSEGPIHSIRQFLLHILTITIGLLIALALEGLVARVHERNLVREARANLRAELSEARAKMQDNLQAQKQSTEAIRALLVFAAALRRDRHTPPPPQDITNTFVILPQTSWNTTAATGAIGLMPYAEVRRYTAAYDGERAYMDAEDNAKRSWFEYAGFPDNYEQMTDAQLDEGERILRILLALEATLTDTGQRLVGWMDDALRQPED